MYDNIWHIRQAPVAVTPHVPAACPIPDARTRILERRQTEDGSGRNFYFVEITYLGGQEPTSTWVQSSDNSEMERGGTEVERVSVGRILQYVSPRELERFENEQFRIEAEAQAVADREAAEEQVRRRMDKNARMARSGRGRGSKMLDGLGIDPELQSTARVDRPTRGRGRGRARGRGRVGWQPRGGLITGGTSHRELAKDEIEDSEPSQGYIQKPPTSRDKTAETSVESENIDSEDDVASPPLLRSAFVANSALPLSPVQPHRSAPLGALQRGHPEVPDIGDTDTTSEEAPMSSAALQVQLKGGLGDIPVAEPKSIDSDGEQGHRSKRRRTESVEPQQVRMFPPSSQIEDLGSEDDSIPADPPSTVKANRYHNPYTETHATPRATAPPLQNTTSTIDEAHENGDKDINKDANDIEEYVVESIIEHYYDQGKKYYLVKWEGYKDSHDWLPEEDLEGATELVSEYNERVRWRKGKAKMT